MQSVVVDDTFKKSCANISRNVKDLRVRNGMSQEVFADECSIDRTYASQIERSIANPSLSVLCRIADALNVSVQDLLN